MKKVLCSFLFAVVALISISAQDAVKEMRMTMVDGVEADVFFFSDWKAAAAYEKTKTPLAYSVNIHYDFSKGKIVVRDGRKSKDDYIYPPAKFRTKNEMEPGHLIDKDFNEGSNSYADEVLKILKETNCFYARAYVEYDDELVLYRLSTSKKQNKVRVNRYSLYKASNPDYLNYISKELSKEAGRKISAEEIKNMY